MSAAVAWSPSSTEIGSPDAARVRTKTSTATTASTASMPAALDRMNLCIARLCLLDLGVPEERPGCRLVVVQGRAARREAAELADVDVGHFVVDHLLHLAPQR